MHQISTDSRSPATITRPRRSRPNNPSNSAQGSTSHSRRPYRQRPHPSSSSSSTHRAFSGSTSRTRRALDLSPPPRPDAMTRSTIPHMRQASVRYRNIHLHPHPFRPSSSTASSSSTTTTAFAPSCKPKKPTKSLYKSRNNSHNPNPNHPKPRQKANLKSLKPTQYVPKRTGTSGVSGNIAAGSNNSSAHRPPASRPTRATRTHHTQIDKEFRLQPADYLGVWHLPIRRHYYSHDSPIPTRNQRLWEEQGVRAWLATLGLLSPVFDEQGREGSENSCSGGLMGGIATCPAQRGVCHQCQDMQLYTQRKGNNPNNRDNLAPQDDTKAPQAPAVDASSPPPSTSPRHSAPPEPSEPSEPGPACLEHKDTDTETETETSGIGRAGGTGGGTQPCVESCFDHGYIPVIRTRAEGKE